MYSERGCHNVGNPFFHAIALKRTPLRKVIPLINSTSHSFTNNCVAYLADICDILPLFYYKNVTYLPLFCDNIM